VTRYPISRRKMTISIPSSPISITRVPYRYSYQYPIDVRSPISVSHIDIGSYLVTLQGGAGHRRGLVNERVPLRLRHAPGERPQRHALWRKPRGHLRVGAPPLRGQCQLPAARDSAVQVDASKSKLKAPGTKRLKLNYDESPSNFALKFNLRRYTEMMPLAADTMPSPWACTKWQGLTLVHFSAQLKRFLWDRGPSRG